MKFSDNTIRDLLDDCFVKRSEKEFEQREEYNSNLWEIETYNIAYDKSEGSPVHLYKTPARDVKISENIYDEKGIFIAYRSE